jgi:hypothetical protein
MKTRSTGRFAWLIWLSSLVSLLPFPSAGYAATLSDPLGLEAVAASVRDVSRTIDELQRDMARESKSWQELISTLPAEARTALGQSIQKFQSNLGVTIDYAEFKVHSNLDALRSSLLDLLLEIQTVESEDKLVHILSNWKFEPKLPNPAFGSAVPDPIVGFQRGPETATFSEPVNGIVTLSGYGFEQPADQWENWVVEVVRVSGDKELARPLKNAHFAIQNLGAFQLSLDLTSPYIALAAEDRWLRLYWKPFPQRRANIALRITEPPPVPTVTRGELWTRTGDENKEGGRGYKVWVWKIDQTNGVERETVLFQPHGAWDVLHDGPYVYPNGSENQVELAYTNQTVGGPHPSNTRLGAFPVPARLKVRIETHDQLDWKAMFRLKLFGHTGEKLWTYTTEWTGEKFFEEGQSRDLFFTIDVSEGK